MVEEAQQSRVHTLVESVPWSVTESGRQQGRENGEIGNQPLVRLIREAFPIPLDAHGNLGLSLLVLKTRKLTRSPQNYYGSPPLSLIDRSEDKSHSLTPYSTPRFVLRRAYWIPSRGPLSQPYR